MSNPKTYTATDRGIVLDLIIDECRPGDVPEDLPPTAWRHAELLGDTLGLEARSIIISALLIADKNRNA